MPQSNRLLSYLVNAAAIQIGTPVMREVVLGDIGINGDVVSPDPCGGSVPAAGALVLTFLLNNYQDPDYQRLAAQWEEEVRLLDLRYCWWQQGRGGRRRNAIFQHAKDTSGNP